MGDKSNMTLRPSGVLFSIFLIGTNIGSVTLYNRFTNWLLPDMGNHEIITRITKTASRIRNKKSIVIISKANISSSVFTRCYFAQGNTPLPLKSSLTSPKISTLLGAIKNMPFDTF
jgi:hypothetical protein